LFDFNLLLNDLSLTIGIQLIVSCIASKWLKHFSIDCVTEQIIITSGTQNALSVILISLFDKGDRIIVDEYTYTGLVSLSELFGIILVPIKTNYDGIDIDELKITCKSVNAKGIYLIPDCHNPTTAILSKDKRLKIAEIILKYNLLLIEDSPFGFTVQDKIKPISHYIPDNSIYVAGTSKSINPTFRISYIVAPRKYSKQLIHGMNNLTWMASLLNAEIVSQLLNSSRYDEIIAFKLSKIKERNILVDDILSDYHLIPNETSLFRYLILPQSISDKNIELFCLEKGVQIFSSKRFLVSAHPNINAIRLSISGPKNIEELSLAETNIKHATISISNTIKYLV
jgi:DNA-binding transcriptional MocR family regulator